MSLARLTLYRDVGQVTKDLLNFKNKLTPYEGLTLKGRVDKTYLRGQLIYGGTQDAFTGLGLTGVLL